jgi:short-subunit dehydrogenase
MSRDISGLTVVVTGGARGIGRATAARFARDGARVAIGDLDADLAGSVAENLAGAHGSVVVGDALDVTDPESWSAFLARVADLGPVDVLVNNAGVMPLGPVVDEPVAVQRAIVDVNVHGVVNGTKAVAPAMIERGRGHIVNIASAVGRAGTPGAATYSASKFAVVGFSEAVRLEFRPHGVDVTVVLPTIVQTELSAGVASARGVKRVTPEQVAAVIADAVRKPRPELWVPTWTRSLAKATSVLPLRLREAIGRAMGADRVLLDADPTAREAYEDRARRPGAANYSGG